MTERSDRGRRPARFRVLELAHPSTAMAVRLLADAGADVIRVQTGDGPTAPGGEAGRRYFETDVQRVAADLSDASDRERLRALIAAVDIVIESTAPGTLAPLGLGYDDLAAAQPNLVVVSVTPFGQTGPYAGMQADDLVAFAMGGLMFISGDPELAPVVAPCEQAWVVGGVHAASAALACVRQARQTGRGEWVDVSVVECLAAQENTVTNVRGPGEFSRRTGSQHRTANPGRIFRAQDGYIHIFVNQERSTWERFLEWIGRPPELAAPELAEINQRWKHAEVVTQAMERFAATRTRAELFTTGQALHLPVVPVYTVAEMLADPQAVHLDMLEEVAGEEGTYRTLRRPLGIGGTRSPAPAGATAIEAFVDAGTELLADLTKEGARAR